jgi:uncharacterized protein (DUF1800 family)
MHRAGFGPNLSQILTLDKLDIQSVWKEYKTTKAFVPLTIDESLFFTDYQSLNKTDAETKRQIQKLNKQETVKLNISFFNQMINSEDQLREKMAFFWHGHFATRINNAKFNAQILNVFREKGLGKFSDLLFAVSKSSAMLQFLNNQQNKKGHPNENFAREVMELFTMGRGNYTETDIKEAARAYTGWTYDKEGNFVNREKQHDEGVKSFLGKTGNFNGDDVLNIILDHPATATFITTKIYKFFVNEIPNPEIIRQLSSKFRNSGYDIKGLMNEIFSSDWFYADENIGVKIKSPIELMSGILRIIPIEFDNPQSIIQFQRLLGQMLLFPPNVAGWPSGKSWIDSSTLLLRMQLPQIWTGLLPLDVRPKEYDDIDMGMKSRVDLKKVFKISSQSINWDLVENSFKNGNLENFILQKNTSLDMDKIKAFSDNSIKMQIINLMSTPEFQLC